MVRRLDGGDELRRGGRGGGRRPHIARRRAASSNPSAAQKPAQVFDVIAPIVTQPSALRTAWYGAWFWCAEPRGRPTSPVAKYRPASQTDRDTADSNSETSRYWPCPDLVPLPQRGHHAEGEVEAAHQVADGDAHLDRFAVRSAGDAHQPAAGLGHDVQPGQGGERPFLPPPGSRGVDDARVDLPDGREVEPQAAHRARPEVLDDGVGGRGQPEEGRAARRRLEVERHRLLVAVESGERGAVLIRLGPIEERSRRPNRVGGRRVLDLEHPGAEIGELHPGERRGHEDPDLEHGRPGQRDGGS